MLMKPSNVRVSSDTSVLHLLHRAGQCADELFAANMHGSDLTPRQFVVLRTVAESDEPSQTMLVEKTGIDRSTLADIVRRLVDRGLLQRRRTRRDARMYAVRLTDAGDLLLKAAAPAARSTDERLLGAVSPRDRDAFVAALNHMIAALAPEERPVEG